MFDYCSFTFLFVLSCFNSTFSCFFSSFLHKMSNSNHNFICATGIMNSIIIIIYKTLNIFIPFIIEYLLLFLLMLIKLKKISFASCFFIDTKIYSYKLSRKSNFQIIFISSKNTRNRWNSNTLKWIFFFSSCSMQAVVWGSTQE